MIDTDTCIPSMISFTVVYTKQNNFVVSRTKTVFLKLKNSDSMTTLKIIKFSLAVNSKKFMHLEGINLYLKQILRYSFLGK